MKRFIAILVLALVCAAFVSAQALKMKDDTNAVLRGNIVKKIKHEKYLFKDATGEVDKDFNKIEFDVDIVKKVN